METHPLHNRAAELQDDIASALVTTKDSKPVSEDQAKLIAAHIIKRHLAVFQCAKKVEKEFTTNEAAKNAVSELWQELISTKTIQVLHQKADEESGREEMVEASLISFRPDDALENNAPVAPATAQAAPIAPEEALAATIPQQQQTAAGVSR